MSENPDLKQIERKAYRSIFQDGLFDIEYGLIVISMAIFMGRPPEGYSIFNLVFLTVCCGFSFLVFWLGKKFVTIPRMGQVKFGETRKKSKRTMSFLLAVAILIQAGVVIFTSFAWLNEDAANSLNNALRTRDIMDLVVASIGALFVGAGMLIMAFFQDFPRGYYIAILMMLAVFLMLYLNQFIYPLIIGALIILPGLVLFIRFIRKYPLPANKVHNE